MNNKIIHVGHYVDDQNFHGAAFIAYTGEVIKFKCRPNTKGKTKLETNVRTETAPTSF